MGDQHGSVHVAPGHVEGTIGLLHRLCRSHQVRNSLHRVCQPFGCGKRLLSRPTDPELGVGPSQVWGSGGNSRLRERIVCGLLPEAGTERAIVDGTADL